MEELQNVISRLKRRNREELPACEPEKPGNAALLEENKAVWGRTKSGENVDIFAQH